MFLPHTIQIIDRAIVNDGGETRYSNISNVTVKAMIYKKEKDTLTDGQQARDGDKTQYQVIIMKGTATVKQGFSCYPDLGDGNIGEYVVTSIDQNFTYSKALQNTYFTIKKR